VGWSCADLEGGAFPPNESLKSDVFQMIAHSRHAGTAEFYDSVSATDASRKISPCDRAVILYPSPLESWDSRERAWLSPRRVLDRDFRSPQLFRSAVPCPGVQLDASFIQHKAVDTATG
jgi:hypothetical protein